MLPLCLLINVFNKKSIVLLTFVPQYKICLLHLGAFKILFLTIILRNLIMICLTKVSFMFLHFEFCWISYICEFIFLSLLEIAFLSLLYFITFYHFCQLFPAVLFFLSFFLCNLLIIFFEDSKYTYMKLLEIIS